MNKLVGQKWKFYFHSADNVLRQDIEHEIRMNLENREVRLARANSAFFAAKTQHGLFCVFQQSKPVDRLAIRS